MKIILNKFLNPIKQKLNLPEWLSLLSFFVFVFLIFYFFRDYTIFDIYTERDIQRSLNWLKGEFYWPGPEMTSGNNLPGPLFYFLLFPPLLFGENIYSQSLIWHFIWLSLTYTVAFHLANRICKHKESLYIFIMFLIVNIGSSLFQPLNYGWNASFSILFHLLAVMTLHYWRETGKNSYLYFSGLVIGFGIQIHFLLSVHLLTAFLFFIFDKKSVKSAVLFVLLFLLPSLPYLLMYGLDVFTISEYSTKYLSNLTENIFTRNWFWSLSRITSFKPYLLGPFLFLFFLIIRKIIKRALPVTKSKESLFVLTVRVTKSTVNLLIITLPPLFISFFVGLYSWYTYFIPCCLMLLFSKLCDELMPKDQKKRLNYLLVYGGLFLLPFLKHITDPSSYSGVLWSTGGHLAVFLLLVPIVVALLVVRGFAYNNLWRVCVLLLFAHILLQKNFNYKSLSAAPPKEFHIRWLSYEAMEPLLEQIILRTGWTAQTAIKRIFLIGGPSHEISLFSYYSLAKEKLKRYLAVSINPSGSFSYFIIQHLERFTDYTAKDWKKYLSDSPFVPELIQKEIKSNKLIIKAPRLYKRHWLIPYKVTGKSIFPEGFHNTAQPYYWEEPEWLKNCKSTQQFAEDENFYYCMILPGHLQRAGVYVKPPKKTKKLRVAFFGPLLGLKAKFSNTDGYAYWSNIQVSVVCDNREHSYSAPDLGRSPGKYNFTSYTKSLKSPLKLEFPIPCQKEISQLKLNFEHLKGGPYDYLLDYSKIPSKKKEIVWKVLEQ